MSIPVNEIKEPFEVVLDNFLRCPRCDGAFRTGSPLLKVDQLCPLCGRPTGYVGNFFSSTAVETALGATQSYYHREPAGFEIYGKDESKAAVVIMFCVFLEALFSQLMRTILGRKWTDRNDIDQLVEQPRNWPQKMTWFEDETGAPWAELIAALSKDEPLVPETQRRLRTLVDTRNKFVHANRASVPAGAADGAMELLYPALYFFAAAHNHLLGLGPPNASTDGP